MDDNIQKKLAALRENYAKNLKNKIATIETTWKILQKHWEQEQLNELYRLVHNLHGSSSTYGFNEISGIAHDLEMTIKPLLKKNASFEEIQCIEKLIVKLTTFNHVQHHY